MKGSAKSVIYPNELTMLSELLNEALGAARPEDEMTRQVLAVRLGRLLVQEFTAGVTDRDRLRATIHRAARLTLH